VEGVVGLVEGDVELLTKLGELVGAEQASANHGEDERGLHGVEDGICGRKEDVVAAVSVLEEGEVEGGGIVAGEGRDQVLAALLGCLRDAAMEFEPGREAMQDVGFGLCAYSGLGSIGVDGQGLG